MHNGQPLLLLEHCGYATELQSQLPSWHVCDLPPDFLCFPDLQTTMLLDQYKPSAVVLVIAGIPASMTEQDVRDVLLAASHIPCLFVEQPQTDFVNHVLIIAGRAENVLRCVHAVERPLTGNKHYQDSFELFMEEKALTDTFLIRQSY